MAGTGVTGTAVTGTATTGTATTGTVTDGVTPEGGAAWVASGYRFAPLHGLPALRAALEADLAAAGVRGTVLLADEGVNASICGSAIALDAAGLSLRRRLGAAAPALRRSVAGPGRPFRRLRVRIRAEIVTLGITGVDARRTGIAVGPQAWHALLDDPAVPVIDVRNDYEIAAGRFPGAIDPATASFRAFPRWVREHCDPVRHPDIAMYCTGGIRCEKASAWLLGQGYRTVWQLDGGILGYLEQVDASANRFAGDCLVFDDRGAVSVDLRPAGSASDLRGLETRSRGVG